MIGAGQVRLVDVDITPQLNNHSVKETEVPGELHIVAITRSGKTFLPNPSTKFKTGDIAHLFVTTGSTNKVKRIFGE
jgi:trk system potassium uptake protein TrkA